MRQARLRQVRPPSRALGAPAESCRWHRAGEGDCRKISKAPGPGRSVGFGRRRLRLLVSSSFVTAIGPAFPSARVLGDSRNVPCWRLVCCDRIGVSGPHRRSRCGPGVEATPSISWARPRADPCSERRARLRPGGRTSRSRESSGMECRQPRSAVGALRTGRKDIWRRGQEQ